MLRKKEISDIELFNDIFYKSCMYNPLLTAIYYSGGNIIPFLSNDFFKYELKDDNFKLYNENIKVKSEIDIIEDMGINIEYIDNLDNFIINVKEAIDNDIPVFVPIDRYYWSDRTYNFSTYKKTHSPHFFLIFGYDEFNEKFSVVDITENGSGCFKNSITFCELIECCKSYFKYINKHKIMKISPNSSSTNSNDFSNKSKYIEIYKTNFTENKNEIVNGVENINKAITYYQSCPIDDLKRDGLSKIAKPFGSFQFSKVSQMYQINTFFGYHEDIFSMLKSIISNLNIVKGFLLKIGMEQDVSKNAFKSVVEKLHLVYELEHNYINDLTKILNNEIGD